MSVMPLPNQEARPSRAARFGLFLLRAYRVALSPFLPRACRFVPSCSAYAAEAVGRHGLARGAWLTALRLARCHPRGGSGLDQVPLVPPASSRGR